MKDRQFLDHIKIAIMQNSASGVACMPLAVVNFVFGILIRYLFLLKYLISKHSYFKYMKLFPHWLI